MSCSPASARMRGASGNLPSVCSERGGRHPPACPPARPPPDTARLIFDARREDVRPAPVYLGYCRIRGAEICNFIVSPHPPPPPTPMCTHTCTQACADTHMHVRALTHTHTHTRTVLSQNRQMTGIRSSRIQASSCTHAQSSGLSLSKTRPQYTAPRVRFWRGSPSIAMPE